LLEKRPNKRAARKLAQLEASAAISEPKSDWVHPWDAPFYCFSGSYIRSIEGWTGALRVKVQRIIERERALPSNGPELVGKWSFGCAPDVPRAWITAMGLQTVMQPAFFGIIPWAGEGLAELADHGWVLADHGREILDADVYAIAPGQTGPLEWHRWLLQALFASWEEDFVQAVKAGAAYIMARKCSVLAPFERITWNQWQFFKIDQNLSQPRSQESKWGDPRGPQWKHVGDLPWTATGPAGERLYEIHIAPGAHCTAARF
jgi:hypothetical protein